MDGQLGIMSEKHSHVVASSCETKPRQVHNYDGDTNERLKFISVVAGQRHSIGVVESRHCAGGTAIYVWGHNENGQLSTGDTQSHATPVRLKMFDSRTLLRSQNEVLLQKLFPKFTSQLGTDCRFLISTGASVTSIISLLRHKCF